VVCDGRELLSTAQSAEFLGCEEDVLRQAVKRGALFPAKIGPSLVFTRRDLSRYRARENEAEIARLLQEGGNPLDVYLSNPGRWSLTEVTTVLHRWAQLTGAWVIEGPRGSYARWLERFGLIRITPRQLRRVIELLLVDPTVQQRLHLELAKAAQTRDRSGGKEPPR